MFQASLFKMLFTKIILIYFFLVSTYFSTQTLIRSQIDLEFHCFYLEITWKIHGILCHKTGGNPASVLTHFEIFISKICMKEPGIWHKKPWKNLEFRTKNLEKTWNLVFGKMWEPWFCNQAFLPKSKQNFSTDVLNAGICVFIQISITFDRHGQDTDWSTVVLVKLTVLPVERPTSANLLWLGNLDGWSNVSFTISEIGAEMTIGAALMSFAGSMS